MLNVITALTWHNEELTAPTFGKLLPPSIWISPTGSPLYRWNCYIFWISIYIPLRIMDHVLGDSIAYLQYLHVNE